MAVIDLCLLHGFLGQGQDWDEFLAHFGAISKPDFQAWAPDLFVEGPLSPRHSFSEFSVNLNHEFRMHKSSSNHPSVLLGYSMGGRLALHALMKGSRSWDAAIIISANPGGLSDEESSARMEWENQWQERFLKQNWIELLRDWNSQGVFQADSKEPVLKEEDVSRELLALALQNWSLTRHEVDWPYLASIEIPILWCFGQDDQKYQPIANRLQREGQQVRMIPQTGHRVHRQAAKKLATWVEEFLRNSL